MEVVICHRVSHSISLCQHIITCKNIHCKESLVWFEISGFCDTINPGSSLGLLVFLLLSCVTEILQLWTHNPSPFTCPNNSHMM